MFSVCVWNPAGDKEVSAWVFKEHKAGRQTEGDVTVLFTQLNFTWLEMIRTNQFTPSLRIELLTSETVTLCVCL